MRRECGRWRRRSGIWLRRRAEVALNTRIALPLLALLAGCDGSPRASPRALAADVVADHHVHLLSPELVTDWKSLGVPFSRPDSAYTSVTAILAGGVERVFLVSMAHIYGSEEFRAGLALTAEEEHRRVRLANDHVAREVARAPGAAVGFCSVDPLRPYAVAELARCGSELNLRGAKLHLPLAGFDFSDSTHVGLLAGMASRAAREGRPLLLHLSPYDRAMTDAELETFAQRVVLPNPRLELILAHLGGNGGYRDAAQRVVRAFAEILPPAEREAPRHVYFELSGGIQVRETDGVPASTDAELAALATDLRALGLHRVLFGSDYPVFQRDELATALRQRVPLEASEIERILDNRAPSMDQLGGAGNDRISSLRSTARSPSLD